MNSSLFVYLFSHPGKEIEASWLETMILNNISKKLLCKSFGDSINWNYI